MAHFQVDTGGTLTTGLVSYYALEDVSDSFGSNTLTNTGTATFIAAQVNNGVSLDGSTQDLTRSNVLSAATTNISVFCWVYLSGSSLKGAFFHNGDHSAGGDGFALGVGGTTLDNDGNNLIGLLDNVAWMNFGSTIGTGWHFVGITRDATTWKGWIDNSQAASTFTTNPGTPTNYFTIGGDLTGTARRFAGTVDELGFWTKELSSTERDDLYNGGTGQTMTSAYSLSVSHGSFTETGQAVGLLAQRLLSVAVGSFTLAGQAVALLRTYVFPVAHGAFTLTGQVVSFLLRGWHPDTKNTTSWAQETKNSTSWSAGTKNSTTWTGDTQHDV